MAIQQTLDLMDGFKGMDNGFSRGDLTGLFQRIGKFGSAFKGFGTGGSTNFSGILNAWILIQCPGKRSWFFQMLDSVFQG